MTYPLDVRHYGARCDGTDDAQAINRALADGKVQKLPVMITGTCAYGSVLEADSVRLVGEFGAVLHSLDPAKSAIFLRGIGAGVSDLRLTGVKPTQRLSSYECSRVSARGASDFLIENVVVDSGAGAAIFIGEKSSNGRIINNRLSNTLADSIHMTNASSYLTVEGNLIENSGDDGIAVVSYANQGSMVHHVTARGNVIRKNLGGRGMTVVGGSDILYENNTIEDNPKAAGIYLAQEASYGTFGAHKVLIRYNLIRQCGNRANGHCSVMLYSSGTDTNTDITLARNVILCDYYGGVKIYSEHNRNVLLDSNIIMATPPTSITSTGVVVKPYIEGSVGVH